MRYTVVFFAPDRSPFLSRLGTLVLGIAFCLALPDTGFSGDKLLITGKKALTAPGQSLMDAKRNERQVQGLEASMPFEQMPVAPTPRYRIIAEKSEVERMRELRDAERENWALLAPGQLQEEHQEQYTFGVEEYQPEGTTKQEEVDDYTFYGLGKGRANNGEAAGGHRLTRASRQEQARQSRAEQLQRRDGSLSGSGQGEGGSKINVNPFRVSTQNPAGVGYSGGFSGNNPRLESSSLSVGGGSLSGGGSTLSASSVGDQNKRMANFRQLLGVQGGSRGIQSGSDLLNVTPDRTRQSLNPALGSPNSSLASPSRRAFEQQWSQQPSISQPRVSGFSSLPSLDLQRSSAPEPSSRLFSTPNATLDAPNRRF